MEKKIEEQTNHPLNTPLYRPDAFIAKLKVVGETKGGYKIKKIVSIKKTNA